jgi:hypothetical protein
VATLKCNKMNKLIILFAVISIYTFCEKTFAQDNIGIKFFGLSIHPKGEKDNSFLMPNKLDKNAYLVMNFGAELMYEKFLYKDIVSMKVVQALYADCAEKLGGFSHIGIRAKIFKIGKHSLSGGIGPTLVYRRNWQEMNGYINPNRFKGDVNEKWQHLFLWYGGEFEYKYKISDKIDFSASFIPGYPDLMSLAVGVNLKLINGKKL